MVFTLVNLYYCDMPKPFVWFVCEVASGAHLLIYMSVKYALSKFALYLFYYTLGSLQIILIIILWGRNAGWILSAIKIVSIIRNIHIISLYSFVSVNLLRKILVLTERQSFFYQ